LIRNDDELLTTVVDGELIGMSVEQGACYGLNGVGTRIWELLAEPRSIDSLCEQLVQEYRRRARVFACARCSSLSRSCAPKAW
jgi:hypothetical protein